MTASKLEQRQPDVSNIEIERAYLVNRRDLLSGLYPFAEPVVLVDLALSHLHPNCRQIELLDPPVDPLQAPPLHRAVPLFVVDMRAACLYEGARPAVVVRDLRSERA